MPLAIHNPRVLSLFALAASALACSEAVVPSFDDETTDGDTGAQTEGYSSAVTDSLALPWPPDSYDDPELPAHFEAVLAFDNTPADNPTTDAGATLGRVLFFDTTLSANQTVACASCHRQVEGFSDSAVFSEGFDGGLTGRHSMGLSNSRFYASGRFFWDERAATLEEQVLMPIQDQTEMGLTLAELVERVSARRYYPELFEQAFGDSEVTSERIAQALAQYVRAMVSVDSRYDQGLAEAGSALEPFANFSDEENLGKQLFMGPQGGCARCHLAPVGAPPPPGQPPSNQALFFMAEPANNGLDLGTDSDDAGVAGHSGDPDDLGAFKSPSLRNLVERAPYMHDGRFATLEEVIEHYDSGVQPHPNLDQRLRGPGGQPRQLGLTAQERGALVAFLGTLSDPELLTDPRFADPFL